MRHRRWSGRRMSTGRRFADPTFRPPPHLATFRCYSSSSNDHVSFIKDIVATQPPKHLLHLLKMLQVRENIQKSCSV
ncbi:hypothetical protein ACSBR1_021130 [Camellia fascicularis]